MRRDQYTVTASHDDLHRALAQLIRDQQQRRQHGSGISRAARAVRYLEPTLIVLAGGLAPQRRGDAHVSVSGR